MEKKTDSFDLENHKEFLQYVKRHKSGEKLSKLIIEWMKKHRICCPFYHEALEENENEE